MDSAESGFFGRRARTSSFGSRGDPIEHRRGSASTTHRTLLSVLVHVLVLRIVMFGVTVTVLGLAGGTFVAPSTHSSVEEVVTLRPSWHAVERVENWRPSSWTTADQRAYPGCVPTASWPHGEPAASVIGYRLEDRVRREVPFARAWAMNHNGTRVDDIWTLAICRAPQLGGTHRTMSSP